jgi:hypothetical protein
VGGGVVGRTEGSWDSRVWGVWACRMSDLLIPLRLEMDDVGVEEGVYLLTPLRLEERAKPSLRVIEAS